MVKMKKVLLILIMFFITTGSAMSEIEAEALYGIDENDTIYYSLRHDKWLTQKKKRDKVIELKRGISSGGENYSEYYTPSGEKFVPAGSNYEFIFDNKLITYHIYEMKYYQIAYNKGNFKEILLSEKELRGIFPKVEIVYMSQFKNNKIVLKKFPIGSKMFLLLNDTDKYFYRYEMKPSINNEIFKNLIQSKKPVLIEYSHYIKGRNAFPVYIIEIKNGLN